jgi:hypothetical protein
VSLWAKRIGSRKTSLVPGKIVDEWSEAESTIMTLKEGCNLLIKKTNKPMYIFDQASLIVNNIHM